ncbi:MAG: glutamate racemase [Oscillospiraceae bacterium]|nr:glutamate racemase [Oscillospiraceae bacterium]
MDKRAVGIFDSGLGGLCAVREAVKMLPGENIVYFGDSGRVPYGSRSYDIIQKYARQAVSFLKSKDTKIVLVACGTVSGVAMDYLKETFSDIPLIGVVEAACVKAVGIARKTQNKKIGVIGTEATITKGAYKKYISGLDENCTVYAKACPLFVPLVECGHLDGDEITRLAARRYLGEFQNLNLSSLVLGCTHYPFIKNTIGEIVNTELIDVGLEAVHVLKKELEARNLSNTPETKGAPLIYVSDEALNFSRIASNFLGFDISGGVTKIDIEKF